MTLRYWWRFWPWKKAKTAIVGTMTACEIKCLVHGPVFAIHRCPKCLMEKIVKDGA